MALIKTVNDKYVKYDAHKRDGPKGHGDDLDIFRDLINLTHERRLRTK